MNGKKDDINTIIAVAQEFNLDFLRIRDFVLQNAITQMIKGKNELFSGMVYYRDQLAMTWLDMHTYLYGMQLFTIYKEKADAKKVLSNIEKEMRDIFEEHNVSLVLGKEFVLKTMLRELGIETGKYLHITTTGTPRPPLAPS